MLLEQLLLETKIDWIQNQMGEQLIKAAHHDHSAKQLHSSKEILDVLSKIDKTKNLVWVARMYTKGLFKIEDVNKLKKTFTEFNRVKSKLKNKDLNSYKDVKSLYVALEPFAEKDVQSKRQLITDEKLKGAEYFINTPKFKVIIPRTHKASCLYGANTEWCTASRDEPEHFDDYSEKGNIYIIIANKRKFQLHYESDSFMDEHDAPIEPADVEYLSQFHEYREFLNKLIEKHYVPHIPKDSISECVLTFSNYIK